MKTPDEIARDVWAQLCVEERCKPPGCGCLDAIAAAITTEREAWEKAEAELDEARRDQCTPSCNAIVDAANERAEKAEAETKAAKLAHEAALGALKISHVRERTARTDALREAAEVVETSHWRFASAREYAATILALIDKEPEREPR